ncbi:MAG: hypothetical protein INR73_22160 [Williamsia sp.]|nr:hypothetical protein [Williamsia sp.]
MEHNPHSPQSNNPDDIRGSNPDPNLVEPKRITATTAPGERETVYSKIINREDSESIPVKLIPSEGGYESNISLEDDEQLWRLIKKRTINFPFYIDLMNSLLRCNPGILNKKDVDEKLVSPYSKFYNEEEKKMAKNRLPFMSSAAYSLLKFATEKFVKATVDLSDNEFWGSDMLTGSPYLDMIQSKIQDYRDKMNGTCNAGDLIKMKSMPVLIELIWSYWHEEGMLVQTMNAISKRFQNIRSGPRDPLANLEIDPLRPLNNILWGYIQDAQHRLTISRRVYEYDHHYGIQLIGSKISNFTPADSRSRFIGAFHNLLYRCAIYFKEADDLTRRPDGFGILNSLKEVHLLLAEGAHNQFGDLPTTARVEMMIEQWILSQPEIREFLGGRVMTPYDEPWMDRVDTMKNLQG